MIATNTDIIFADLLEWQASLATTQKPPTRYRLYALIDGVLDPSLLGEAERCDIAWRGLYPESMLESRTPAMGPLLVELEPAHAGHEAFMRLLIKRSRTQDLVMWMASRQALDPLAGHLQVYAEVKLPDGRRALLRHYDPSILEILVPMFDAQQRADFLAGVRGYRYWRDGWRDVVGADAELLPEPPADSIALTPVQFELLSNESFAETLYHRIKDELLPPVSTMNSHDCITAIRGLLARAAQTHGLKSESDLTYFTLLALNIHPSFDTHAPIAEALAAQIDSDAPLTAKLAGVDASIWDELLRKRDEAAV
ncbi:DUF4123 domain-containing protein [Paraburkholderia bannensis]|uniref:DUF4123 domain-containing protein n=1 Tax=Paraburkholderia bannensis TaxID=765414 RepID=UPI002AB2B356|nr:DUF4123 domain-containing protein [Paraburkholderia bannensis]